MQKPGGALLDDWMRLYYFAVDADIGSSGVSDYSMAEVRALPGAGRPDGTEKNVSRRGSGVSGVFSCRFLRAHSPKTGSVVSGGMARWSTRHEPA